MAQPGSWNSFDYGWNLLCQPHAKLFLGEARLYLAKLDAEGEVAVAPTALYSSISGPLPWTDGVSAGVPVLGKFALWEAGDRPDERTLRRLAVAIAPGADPIASAWAWSGGGTAIPPLARYLLHAAKLRYELRVWLRDSRSRQLESTLDSLGSETALLGAQDPRRAELLAVRSNEARRLSADLGILRKSVEIAADNMSRSVDLADLMIPGGPFADDARLAQSLLERIDDQVDYLDRAIQKAALTSALSLPRSGREQAGEPTVFAAESSLHQDRSRNVFVVYGRDEKARRAMFEFLRALDLRPLQWEALVQRTGRAAPSLSETVRRGMQISTAVIVLMTPEDIVRLHPDLHDQPEGPSEMKESMQARPNVLLELGMAYAMKPDQTIILFLGQQRPVTDLGGVNYVQIKRGSDWRSKVASRLELTGCPVDMSGQDWLHAGNFDELDGHDRGPDDGPGSSQ